MRQATPATVSLISRAGRRSGSPATSPSRVKPRVPAIINPARLLRLSVVFLSLSCCVVSCVLWQRGGRYERLVDAVLARDRYPVVSSDGRLVLRGPPPPHADPAVRGN